jgi:hypothetical protein
MSEKMDPGRTFEFNTEEAEKVFGEFFNQGF